MVTDAQVYKVDPRINPDVPVPFRFRMTELERVWGGPSTRYWKGNSTIMYNGTKLENRNCTDFVYNKRFTANSRNCGDYFNLCCDIIDDKEYAAFSCGIGIIPTMCKYAENRIYTNRSGSFRMISLEMSHPEMGGNRTAGGPRLWEGAMIDR